MKFIYVCSTNISKVPLVDIEHTPDRVLQKSELAVDSSYEIQRENRAAEKYFV
jgi:hypothetical protein